MAKYEVKRNNIYYSDDTTGANEVTSFCAETNEQYPNQWFGFYDFSINAFHVIPSEWNAINCLELESHENESLTQFEVRLRSLIYNYCGDVVNLVSVATDYSCMDDMKWAPEIHSKEDYSWEN